MAPKRELRQEDSSHSSATAFSEIELAVLASLSVAEQLELIRSPVKRARLQAKASRIRAIESSDDGSSVTSTGMEPPRRAVFLPRFTVAASHAAYSTPTKDAIHSSLFNVSNPLYGH